MSDGQVKIAITGDDSGLQKTLQQVSRSARSAASAMGAEFQKAGMSQSEAMKRAWTEVKKAQQEGTTVMINGVETLIDKNEKLEESFEGVGDAASKAGKEAGNAMEHAASGMTKASGGAGKLVSGLQSVGKAASAAYKGITIVAGAASAAWNIAGIAIAKYNGDMEQLLVSFEVMTGSAEKGAEVLEQIRKLGASTPFETKGLAEVTQLLMNYNLTADEAISSMTMLGDISQGSQDKLNRIATAYGQMNSAGKVMLEDIKQMIEAGFNPLVEISESTGESMASLYDRISKGTLAVDEITASMIRSTSEGGKYFQSMEKQSKTLNGQLSTLKDNAMQLGGNVFQSYTDGIRDGALPMANEIVEELNDAFMARGMEGLSDAVIAQMPKVGDAVSDAFVSGMEGATKGAPKFVKGIVAQLPSLINSGGDMVTAMGDLVLEIAASGLEGLLANSPEIIAGLGSFAFDLGGSILTGLGKGLLGAGRGLDTMFKKLGLAAWTEEELLAQLFDGYDPDKVKELKAAVKITPDVSVDESKVQLDSVYDLIAEQLTDGEADTPEVIEELEKQVTDYYNAEIAKVNEWKQNALANLDTTLPANEYAAAANAIETEADEMIASLESASDETVRFVSENAGKSTSAVEASLGDLEAIYNSAVGYRNKVAELTGEATNMSETQRNIVIAGHSRDAATQLGAIGYTAVEYEQTIADAEARKAAALQEAQSKYAEGSEAYMDAEKEILEAFEAESEAARDKYLADMNAVWGGIGQAMMPEQQAILQEAYKQAELVNEARDLLNKDSLSMEDISQDMINAFAMQGIDVQELIDAAMGDPDQMSMALQGALRAVIENGEDIDLQAVLLGLMEGMPEDVKNVIQASIENGWLQGVEGVDLTDDQTILKMLAGATPSSEESAAIGSPVGVAMGEGIESGLESQRAKIMATARSLARAAAAGIRDELQIRSPSRITTKMGSQTGEGFDIGLRRSLSSAVKNARNIVGEMNLTQRLLGPDLSGAFGAALEPLAAGNAQPIYLNVDGRTLAQVMTRENVRALNIRSKTVSLGVGR